MKKIILSNLALLFVFAGCGLKNNSGPAPEAGLSGIVSPTKEEAVPSVGIANPASVNCKEKGYQWEVRTGADGGQVGYCINKGKECEEWALFRGECKFD